jgi:REP element-mobilizing transposase RayT
MTEPETNPGLERARYELRADGVPLNPPNPLRSGIHTRGYLPHVKREGASYFVTFRLIDSLPQKVLLELKRRQAEKLRALKSKGLAAREEIDRDFQRQVERYLDRAVGECHLKRGKIARMTADALCHFHEQHYLLEEWVIMPNHVHLLIWPMPNNTLSSILRSRKRHIAREANLTLGRTGKPFWQPESYDHWARSDEEKARIRRYIRNNPVIAGLRKSPEKWQWGSAGYALNDARTFTLDEATRGESSQRPGVDER